MLHPLLSLSDLPPHARDLLVPRQHLRLQIPDLSLQLSNDFLKLRNLILQIELLTLKVLNLLVMLLQHLADSRRVLRFPLCELCVELVIQLLDLLNMFSLGPG